MGDGERETHFVWKKEKDWDAIRNKITNKEIDALKEIDIDQ